MSVPVVTLVVPCYNEEAVLPDTIDVLHQLVEELVKETLISDKSKILFVDDGSSDQTWELIYKTI